MFEFQRVTHVYETDLMGIVHHSNYLRFCEEARVAWCIDKKMLDTSQQAVYSLAVIETHVQHISPIRYPDRVRILVQARWEGVRIFFQYHLQIMDMKKKVLPPKELPPEKSSLLLGQGEVHSEVQSEVQGEYIYRTAAKVQTAHCRLDKNFKVLRLDQKITDLLKEEKWTETWL